MKVNNTIAKGVIREIMQKVDALESGIEYLKEKIECDLEHVEIEARNAFLSNLITTLVIKCANGFNQHIMRDALINKQRTDTKCPRCSSRESY